MAAQQLDHARTVARQAVDDVGGLLHAFHQRALRVQAVQAAVDQLFQLLQQFAVDVLQPRDVDQHQIAAVLRQRVDHLPGQRRRQEGEEHRLHAHVFAGDAVGQPLRRHPLQACHFRADGVAVDIVEHAVGDVAAQRQIERALEEGAAGAVHPALLAVFVEELLDAGLHRVDLDAAQRRHLLRHRQQLLARQAAQHRRCRLLAHAQQQDGGLFQRRHAFRVAQRDTGTGRRVVQQVGLIEFVHFSVPIV